MDSHSVLSLLCTYHEVIANTNFEHFWYPINVYHAASYHCTTLVQSTWTHFPINNSNISTNVLECSNVGNAESYYKHYINTYTGFRDTITGMC